ncbi:Fic family protein [Thiomicrospira sp. ALE5]|uniref:Fic family protein n=1 Tax=Thiomicrospira sp. ALE5 TaxID=748650 RepID=UPI0008ECE9B8|nr:Fic family protein [Thiomicrospira sp. ALE5]SFR61315.1 Fido, protein-threonine AMPylation domain-containing protein [Thiomicrospira sp. ALE5]
MNEFGQYKKISDPDKRQKAENWRIAIGLQEVDGLTPSPYLIQIAIDNIEGKLSVEEAEQEIATYYRHHPPGTASEQRKREADEVSSRINKLLSTNAFTFSPAEYIAIHKYLFTGILDAKVAGQLRAFDITKSEPILHGESVQYGSALNLRETLDYDFTQEKKFSYRNLTKKQAVAHIAEFISDLWQIHPFAEGNTRTTAVFLIKYLRQLGFKADNSLFEENALYFRNALVRANYQNLEYGIEKTTAYLDRFFGNLLFGEQHPLKNRDLMIVLSPENPPAVTRKPPENHQKILHALAHNPSASRKELSVSMDMTENQVRGVINKLRDAGIIRRVGPDKGGYWQIITGE